MKKTNQQAMVANLYEEKVQTHLDDEVRYIFTPIKQSYNIDEYFALDKFWKGRESIDKQNLINRSV
jgi:hypothetical protein